MKGTIKTKMDSEDLLEQMEADVTCFARVAELVNCNRHAIIGILKQNSKLFEENEEQADFVATIIRDVCAEFGDQLAELVEQVNSGDVTLRSAPDGKVEMVQFDKDLGVNRIKH